MTHPLRITALALVALPAAAFAQAPPLIDSVELEESLCSRPSDDQHNAAARAGVPAPRRSCDLYAGDAMSWPDVAGADAYQVDVWEDYGEGLQFVGNFRTQDTSLELSGGPAEAYYVSIRPQTRRGIDDAAGTIVIVNHARPDSAGFPEDETAEDESAEDGGGQCVGEEELLSAIDTLVASHWAVDAELREVRDERDQATKALEEAELDLRRLQAENARLRHEAQRLRDRLRRQKGEG